jgi:hypothetical protein
MTYDSIFGEVSRQVTATDAQDLGEGRYLSDISMNAIMNKLGLFEKNHDAVLLDAQFLNRLESLIRSSDDTNYRTENITSSLPASSADDAEMLTKTAPPMSGNRTSCVIMPLCFGQLEDNLKNARYGQWVDGHWVIIVLHRGSDKWVLFSSIPGYQENYASRERIQRLVNYCAQRWNRSRRVGRDNPVFVESECTRQYDSVNCGIYAIVNVNALLQEAAREFDLRHIEINPMLKRQQYFEILYGQSYDSVDWEPLGPTHDTKSTQSSSSVENWGLSSSDNEVDMSGTSIPTTATHATSQSTSGQNAFAREIQRQRDLRSGVSDEALRSEIISIHPDALELLPEGSYQHVGNTRTGDQLFDAYIDAVNKYLRDGSWHRLQSTRTFVSPPGVTSMSSPYGEGNPLNFGSNAFSQQGLFSPISQSNQQGFAAPSSRPPRQSLFTGSSQPFMDPPRRPLDPSSQSTFFNPLPPSFFNTRPQPSASAPGPQPIQPSIFETSALYTPSYARGFRIGDTRSAPRQPTGFVSQETADGLTVGYKILKRGRLPWWDSSPYGPI